MVPLLRLGNENIPGKQGILFAPAFEHEGASQAERKFKASGVNVLGKRGAATRVVAVSEDGDTGNIVALKGEHTPFGRVDIVKKMRVEQFAHDA